MKPINCYLVHLPTTNATHKTARDGDGFIDVMGGAIHVLAIDAAEVGRRFPQAERIELAGLGIALSAPATGEG